MPETAWDWPLFGWHVFQVFVYVLIGLGAFGLAYLVLDKATTFSLRKELMDEHNTALAIVLGAVFLGIAIVVAAAIRS